MIETDETSSAAEAGPENGDAPPIRVGLLLERAEAAAALARRLEQEEDLQVTCLDHGWSDILPTIEEQQVLVVGSGLPRGGALKLLGRSWTAYRFPRLVFVQVDPDDDPAGGIREEAVAALVEAVRWAFRDRLYVPPRIVLHPAAEPAAIGRAAQSPAYQS